MTECHETQLAQVHPTGVEEWYCPTCGRRVIIQWNPFKWVVLETGNDDVAHSGGTGGMWIRSDVSQEQMAELPTHYNHRCALIPKQTQEIPDDDDKLNELLRGVDIA